MSRLILTLLLACATPAAVWAQEVSAGYQGIVGFEGDGLHGGFARLVSNSTRRFAGVVQLYGAYDPKKFVATSPEGPAREPLKVATRAADS